MKRITLIIFTALVFGSLSMMAQTAPITTLGAITNAAPGTVTIPVTVSNYTNIFGISLKFYFDPAHLQYSSLTPNPILNGLLFGGNNTTGAVTFSSMDLGTGSSMPDGTVLFTVTFTYTGGSSALTWSSDDSECEYTNQAGSSLPDSPRSTFYKNGIVTDHPAPLTIAPSITNAVPGTVSPNITVRNFTNVGKIKLTLEYDPAVLTFNSYTPNAAFGGSFTLTSEAGAGGKMNLVMTRNVSTAITLADNSILVVLNFTYSNSTAGYCDLKWIDNGTSCQYSDPVDVVMPDLPQSTYYQDGLIAGQIAPTTHLPVTLNATIGTVWVPVTATNFTNLTSLSLKFKYNSTVLTFLSSPAYTSSLTGLTVSNVVLADTGTITISWSSVTPATLSGMATIVNIPFTYSGSFSTLNWIDDGTSCEFLDAYAHPLYDTPTATWYTNGAVGSQPSPIYKVDSLFVGGPQSVSLEVRVKQYTNIGSTSLTLLYDPSLLSTPTVTPNASLGGVFNYSVPTPGRINISWYNVSGVTLANNASFCTLAFTYAGGTAPITFYDSGMECISSTVVPSSSLLYDLPQSTYYINGLVGIGTTPVLNVKAFLQGPYLGSSTMSTILNTKGSIPLTQPYNVAPWNYSGTESVTSIPSGVTDWVLVEFRTGVANSTIIARKACFIKSNGMIVSLDGTSLPTITGINSGNYYIVIRHRNHLAIMSASPASLNAASVLYDFTTSQTQAYGGGMKNVSTGVWGMFGADGDANNSLQSSDYTLWRINSGSNGYISSDYDLDNTAQGSDYTLWRINSGFSTTFPN
jgi:hypothetical protein